MRRAFVVVSVFVLLMFFAAGQLMVPRAVNALDLYEVTIWAWDALDPNGWIAAPITMDGVATVFSTPHTFTGLSGTHNFTVPETNAGHPFSDWDTGGGNIWTDETVTVSSNGTFTARYRAGYSVTIWAWCGSESQGWLSRPIVMDGSPTGFSTPHTFSGLNGLHFFTVPGLDELGHSFYEWDTSYWMAASPTLTVGWAGVYTARYRDTSGDVWAIQTVDTGDGGGVNNYLDGTSLALDTSGYPHIGYFVNGTVLRYARWTGSAWNIQSVDTLPDRYGYCAVSLALDSNNNPHIIYCTDVSGLRYARWTGSSWSIVPNIDNASIDGYHISLALDSSNYPHISYLDATNSDLKYARWTGSAWSIQIVDSAGKVGAYNSIAVDSKGYPHISYREFDDAYLDLKYARWTGSVWNIEIVDSAGKYGSHTSIALDSSDYPHISYDKLIDESSMVLRYASWTGSAWNIQTVDPMYVGSYCSLALDWRGYPHISYYDSFDGALKYAGWTGSAWNIQTVDTVPFGDVGECTSIALDSGGYPHITYTDNLNYDLKYARGQVLPPTGTIAINAGALYTSSASVTLSLTSLGHGSTVSGVRYSNDGSTWTNWESPVASKAWVLASGDGLKAVYFQIKESHDIESQTYFDMITLDTSTPQGMIRINNDAEFTNVTGVTLTLYATDAGSGVSQMCFSNDGVSWSSWEAYATSKSWSLEGGPGTKYVHVQFRDNAGLSVWASDNITLDTMLPVANAGPNQNAQVGQIVQFDGSGSYDNIGIASYSWDFGDGSTGTGALPTHTYLSAGSYTVSLMVKDVAGNSAASSSTVKVEVVIPEFSSTLLLLFIILQQP